MRNLRGSRSVRRAMRGLAALVLLLVFGGGTVVALGAGRDRPAPPASANDLTSDPAFGPQAARAEAAERRRAEERKSPEARAARVRSRHAYESMSRSDAVALAKAKFADTVSAPAWSGPSLRAGERIKRYFDDHRFEVEAADGDLRFLVESQQPVLTEVDGRKRPIDMSLEPAAGGALEPSVTPTPVALGATTSDGVTLGDSGLTMRAVGSGEAPRTEVAEKAFYANTSTDTDFVAAPEPDGVEAFFQLRSADSPSVLAIDFSKTGAS